MDSAQQSYPHDPRIAEQVGVTYAIHQGVARLPIDRVIDRLESAVSSDPWGPYLLIVLANKYLAIAGFAPPPSRFDAKTALARAEQLHSRLQRSAPFSHQTDAIGGTLALLRGDLCTSERLYRRALASAPTDPVATTGLGIIEDFRKRTPNTGGDQCLVSGGK